jgi:hypothetical protein
MFPVPMAELCSSDLKRTAMSHPPAEPIGRVRQLDEHLRPEGGESPGRGPTAKVFELCVQPRTRWVTERHTAGAYARAYRAYRVPELGRQPKCRAVRRIDLTADDRLSGLPPCFLALEAAPASP